MAALAVLTPASSSACPSCFGAAAGPVVDGMNLAVLVMVGVTGGVFSLIASVAVRIVRRERDAREDMGNSLAAPEGESGR